MNICDFERLNQTFFPMQAIGFLLAGISIVALLFFPQRRDVLLAAGTPTFFGGTFVFVSMMVLGCFCFSGGLGVYAFRRKKVKAAVLFWAAFLFMMAMGYLSSRDFTKASMNWIAECVNLAGQLLLLFASMDLVHSNERRT